MTTTQVIKLRSVCKSYQTGDAQFHALNSIDFSVHKNEYIAITGPSGSGKSTLLNLLGCLDIPTSGDYELNGRSTKDTTESGLAAIRNRHIGFIFQNFNLIPRMSVLDNVEQPLVYSGIKRRERRARAIDLLDRVGLGQKHNNLPNQLSGGQKQRVAIARALITEPALILGDEPTGNLDSQTTEEIMQLFDELHAGGQTLLIVTHEQEIAQRCQRQVHLVDGGIQSDITTSKPSSRRVA